MSIKFSWFTLVVIGLVSVITVLFSVHSFQKNSTKQILDTSILAMYQSQKLNEKKQEVSYTQKGGFNKLF